MPENKSTNERIEAEKIDFMNLKRFRLKPSDCNKSFVEFAKELSPEMQASASAEVEH
jgi:hypothetical protein